MSVTSVRINNIWSAMRTWCGRLTSPHRGNHSSTAWYRCSSTSQHQEVGCRDAVDSRQITLSSSGRKVFYESPINPARYEDVYQLVCDAAARGDNVGSDEYPTFEYFRHNLLDCASVTVSVSDMAKKSTGNEDITVEEAGPIIGLIIITPCRYARSSQPTLCTLTMIVSRDLATDDAALQYFIDIGVTKAQGAGRDGKEQVTGSGNAHSYSACVVDVFVTCQKQLMAYRSAGFLITACIPNSGKLTGLKGHADNFILYKEFDSIPTIVRGQPSSAKRHPSTVPVTPSTYEYRDIVGSETLRMVPSPYMPLQFTVSDGTSLTVREMLPDDIPKFYAALLTVMKSGVGYGVDELPDLDYFVKYYVNGWRNVVFELTDTADTVAYGNTDGPTVYSRSVTDPAIADGGNIIVLGKYRGKGWYGEIVSEIIIKPLQKNYGGYRGQPVFTGYLSDMALTNIAGYKGDRKLGFRMNGVIPRGIYLQGHGWADVLLVFISRDEIVAMRPQIENFTRREYDFGITTSRNTAYEIYSAASPPPPKHVYDRRNAESYQFNSSNTSTNHTRLYGSLLSYTTKHGIACYATLQTVVPGQPTSATRHPSTVPVTPSTYEYRDIVGSGTLRMVPSPYMPLQFTVSDGTSLTLREMLPDDIPKFYDALLTVMKSGVGYGADELPDLNYFVKYYVNGWRNMVFELTDTADPVAYGNTDGPTDYSRSVIDPAIADGGNMIVLENYRGKGWYVDMMLELQKNNIGYSGQADFVGYQGDMALTNMATYFGDRKLGFQVNGLLPRGIYLRGHGWVDVLLVYIARDKLAAEVLRIEETRRATQSGKITSKESGITTGLTTSSRSKL